MHPVIPSTGSVSVPSRSKRIFLIRSILSISSHFFFPRFSDLICAHMKQDAIITQRGAERARAGHLWIYRSDVREASGIPGGSIVTVRDERGRFIGQALYSTRSEISLRLVSMSEDEIDREWWRACLRAARLRREGIAPAANAYRLVYAEGDLLPSLIIDVYDD